MCSAFGTAPQELDGRFSGIVHTAMHHGSKHLYYLHRSMERKNADQFVLRQSSVYHARTSESDFWILLHPHPATMLEQRLISFSRSRQPALRHFSDPMTIHGTIITAITTNWHIYTQHLANECSGKANHTFTMESLDEKSTTSSSLPRNFDLGFHELQQMRDLEDVIMSIPIVLNATVTLISEAERAVASSMTVEKVSRAGESGGVEGMRRSEEEEEEEKHLNFFKAQKAILEDIVSVVGVLQGRIRGLRGFMADTLDLRNQYQAARTNDYLLKLIREGVEESGAVRVVTIVTLIYLPATFIAVRPPTSLSVNSPRNRNRRQRAKKNFQK